MDKKFDPLIFESRIQDIPTPQFGPGKLFAATPLKSKPPAMSKEDWTIGLVEICRELVQVEKSAFAIAIPRSFWPSGINELVEVTGLKDGEFIDLMDEWDGPHLDTGPMTPVESIRQIIQHLQHGEDVIVLSHTSKISDFVRALLYLVWQPYPGHPAKVWCGFELGKVIELTQFQRGYIYGLSNATGSFGLEQLRNAHQTDGGI